MRVHERDIDYTYGDIFNISQCGRDFYGKLEGWRLFLFLVEALCAGFLAVYLVEVRGW